MPKKSKKSEKITGKIDYSKYITRYVNVAAIWADDKADPETTVLQTLEKMSGDEVLDSIEWLVVQRAIHHAVAVPEFPPRTGNLKEDVPARLKILVSTIPEDTWETLPFVFIRREFLIRAGFGPRKPVETPAATK